MPQMDSSSGLVSKAPFALKRQNIVNINDKTIDNPACPPYTVGMKVIRRPTAFAAVSELRTGLDVILTQLKETPVSLEKHGKSVAVLVDPERFEAMERALEELSDKALTDEAHRRARSMKGRGVPLKEIEKHSR